MKECPWRSSPAIPGLDWWLLRMTQWLMSTAWSVTRSMVSDGQTASKYLKYTFKYVIWNVSLWHPTMLDRDKKIIRTRTQWWQILYTISVLFLFLLFTFYVHQTTCILHSPDDKCPIAPPASRATSVDTPLPASYATDPRSFQLPITIPWHHGSNHVRQRHKKTHKNRVQLEVNKG